MRTGRSAEREGTEGAWANVLALRRAVEGVVDVRAPGRGRVRGRSDTRRDRAGDADP
jgi:hypothetical protein